MILIRLGSWCSKADNLLVYDRVYTNKGTPTPIVAVHFRHVGEPPQDAERADFQCPMCEDCPDGCPLADKEGDDVEEE